MTRTGRQRYRVTGVIEVYVTARDPEGAVQEAQDRLYRVLDRHARSLNAEIGLDNVTWPDGQENLLK